MSDAIQQQVIAARRAQILEAAAAVFAQKGFHPTTIRDIARHAGIADGTIYNYFPNKTALLFGLFERMRDAVVAQMPPPDPAMDVRTLLRLFVTQPLRAMRQDNFGLFRILAAEMMVNEEIRRLYAQQILTPAFGAGEGLLHHLMAQEGLNPAHAPLLIRTLTSLVLGLVMTRVLSDDAPADDDALPDFVIDTLPDFVIDTLLKGLRDDS